MAVGTGVGAVVEVQAGIGMVPSACVVAEAQHGIVVAELETDVVAEVHLGMSLEMVGVAGVGTKTVAVVCVGTAASVVHEQM